MEYDALALREDPGPGKEAVAWPQTCSVLNGAASLLDLKQSWPLVFSPRAESWRKPPTSTSPCHSWSRPSSRSGTRSGTISPSGSASSPTPWRTHWVRVWLVHREQGQALAYLPLLVMELLLPLARTYLQPFHSNLRHTWKGRIQHSSLFFHPQHALLFIPQNLCLSVRVYEEYLLVFPCP